MFGFQRGSAVHRLPEPIRVALDAARPSARVDASTLAMVELRGRFAGRKVTFFRVFNPTQAASHAPDVFSKLSYADLESHPELVLYAGLLEQDGSVVMTQTPAEQGAVLLREPADRAAHQDDERFVAQSQQAG
jgi:hypothetical protein